MARPTVGSLFSGIGGFDLGLERAGWEVRWQVENDAFCNQILERHWPGVTRYDDITTVNTDRLTPIDLLCGGFPCQDISVAGRREGLAGERSSLFFEFARIAHALSPRWLLVENVAGLFSSSDGRDFGIVISALAELGYGLAWRVLDSQYFGVAQRRRRVFIVGHLGKPCPPEILFEPESLRGDSPPSRQAGAQPAYSHRGGSRERGWLNDAETGLVGAGVSPALRARHDSSSRDGQDIAYALRENPGGPGQGWNTSYVSHPAGQVPAALYHNHQQDGDLREYRDASPTVSRKWGTGGNNIPFVASTPPDPDGMSVRRLTLLECSRLQGFPDTWLAGDTPDSPRYRALGNAVTVPVAEWIGRRILAVHH